jgi:putative transposase
MAAAQDNTVIRSFKYRLAVSKNQHQELAAICESQRILYNAAKQEREDCYRKTGKIRSYIDQCKSLTELRKEKAYAAMPVKMQRWTLKRCDDAFKAFFRRVKAGERPGFPRYKARDRWRSFGFKEFEGIKLHNGRIRFNNLRSSMRVHLHRPLPEGRILSCVFSRDGKGWTVSLQIRVPTSALPPMQRGVGIDVGLKELCFLSTGDAIPHPRIVKRVARELRIKSRALARCKRGSQRRRRIKAAITRCHARVKNTRDTYLHQVSAKLVRENDVIAIEKLNVASLKRSMFAKSIHDAGWSKLKEMIAYKAESAGRILIEVDPRDTTQACSGCGCIVPKTLKERWHCCPHCGLELDRDHNAAINILHRAVLRPGLHNVGQWAERATGNLLAEPVLEVAGSGHLTGYWGKSRTPQ